jgi:hypothetical protein
MPKAPAGGFVQRCFINHPARSNLIPSKPCRHCILKTALRVNMAGQWIKHLSAIKVFGRFIYDGVISMYLQPA